MDRGACWACGHKESDTTKWLTVFLLYQSVWKKADDLKWCREWGNRILLSGLVGMCTHQPLKDPLWLNWVKFGLQVCSVLQSTLVDIIRNIPLAHKEPFLTHSHPSVAKSRRDASRSEKAVHGELWITPSNEFSLHRHEDSEIQMLLRKKRKQNSMTQQIFFKGTHISR